MQIIINKPYALNETGKRVNNEDYIFPPKNRATESDQMFIVCDGMGGYQGGEIASEAVCNSMAQFLMNAATTSIDKEIFQKALINAYEHLDSINKEGRINQKAGTTLAFIKFYDRGAFTAHIGDSRIYQLRKDKAGMKIIHKSEDHSFVNDLVKSGIITTREAKTHPRRNIITRSMQPMQEKRCKADICIIDNIKPNDYFFLCTDGIYESIDDDKLCLILNMKISLEEKINRIFDICQAGSKDNFSAYLISVSEVNDES